MNKELEILSETCGELLAKLLENTFVEYAGKPVYWSTFDLFADFRDPDSVRVIFTVNRAREPLYFGGTFLVSELAVQPVVRVGASFQSTLFFEELSSAILKMSNLQNKNGRLAPLYTSNFVKAERGVVILLSKFTPVLENAVAEDSVTEKQSSNSEKAEIIEQLLSLFEAVGNDLKKEVDFGIRDQLSDGVLVKLKFKAGKLVKRLIFHDTGFSLDLSNEIDGVVGNLNFQLDRALNLLILYSRLKNRRLNKVLVEIKYNTGTEIPRVLVLFKYKGRKNKNETWLNIYDEDDFIRPTVECFEESQSWAVPWDSVREPIKIGK